MELGSFFFKGCCKEHWQRQRRRQLWKQEAGGGRGGLLMNEPRRTALTSKQPWVSLNASSGWDWTASSRVPRDEWESIHYWLWMTVSLAKTLESLEQFYCFLPSANSQMHMQTCSLEVSVWRLPRISHLCSLAPETSFFPQLQNRDKMFLAVEECMGDPSGCDLDSVMGGPSAA